MISWRFATSICFPILAVAMAGLGSAEEAARLVLFNESHPVVVRIQLEVAGVSVDDDWQRRTAKLFGRLDRDGNGVLVGAEVGQVPTRADLVQAELIATSQKRPVSIDGDRDGRVSPAELTRYFRELGVRNWHVRAASSRPASGPLATFDSGLFELLDSNRDNKLSSREIDRAPRALAKYDRNDDERISTRELGLARVATRSPPLVGPQSPAIASLQWLPRGDELRVLSQVVKYFDASDDNQIDSREWPWRDDLFDPCDADDSGSVSARELVVWLLNRPPDAQVVVRADCESGPTAEILEVNEQLAALVESVDGASPAVRLLKTRIDFTGQLRRNVPQGMGRYRAMFQRADADDNGYLDEREMRFFRDFRQLLQTIDRDRDDRIFEAEVVAYLEKQMVLNAANVTLSIDDRGYDIAEVLDADGDRRLGWREFAFAHQLLKMWDSDGDGMLARNEVQQLFRVSWERGVRQVLTPRAPQQATTSTAARWEATLPWFRHMDRNTDGVLSPREFLGTAARFREFDGNGDGVISHEEAKRSPLP